MATSLHDRVKAHAGQIVAGLGHELGLVIGGAEHKADLPGEESGGIRGEDVLKEVHLKELCPHIVPGGHLEGLRHGGGGEIGEIPRTAARVPPQILVNTHNLIGICDGLGGPEDARIF